MLKKIFLSLGLTAAVLSCCSIRSIDGVLEEVDKEDDIYVAYYATEDGNGWVVEHKPALEVGQSCKILFYDNLTESIYDDVIIKVFPKGK